MIDAGNQSAVRKKIAALLKLTTSAGCTEAEAMAAAGKAAALMREHGMSDMSIHLTQSDARLQAGARSVRADLWAAVARCTNTACLHVSGEAKLVRFFGRDPGPEIAGYLVAVLNRALDREIRAFKASETYRARRNLNTRRKAVHDFTSAMVARLSLRLLELFMPQIDRTVARAAKMFLDQSHPDRRLVTRKTSKTRFDAAANAGWGAGQKVKLSHGVGSAQPTERLKIGSEK